MQEKEMVEKVKFLLTILTLIIFLTNCSGDNGKENAEVSSEDEIVSEDFLVDLEVIDNTNPEQEETIFDTVEEEKPCPTFSEVQPIFTANCTSCHPGRDSYSYITSNLDTIKRKVQSYHHIGGDDRQTVLDWIDCGAPP